MAFGKPIMNEVSDDFTRPADTTPYSDEDLVANSTTAGSVAPLVFSIPVGNGRGVKVVGARLQKSSASATNATFSLLLYRSSPVVANGDNLGFSTDTASFIGTVVFPTMTAFTDDALAVVDLGDVDSIRVYLRATDTIYGLLKAEAAYTPTSEETFTATLITEQY